MGLGERLLLYLGLSMVALATIVITAYTIGVPFTGWRGEIRDARGTILAELRLIADTKGEHLLRWIEERRDDVSVLATSPVYTPLIEELAQELENRPRQESAEAWWDRFLGSPASTRLAGTLRRVRSQYGVYDAVHIVSPVDHVVFVSTDEGTVGKPLGRVSYLEAASRHGGVVVETDHDASVLGSGLVFARRVEDPAAPAGAPPLAVVVAECRGDDALNPLLDLGRAVGSSGEVVLVDEHRHPLIQLRHPLADGTPAAPFNTVIDAEPAKRAARGESDIIVAQDYRGERVLAAYTPLFISPETSWGLVVKVDYDEAFAPLRRRVALTVGGGSVGVVVALIVAVFVVSASTKPLRQLGELAQHVREGRLDSRSPARSGGDVGLLEVTFNEMLDRLRDRQEALENALEHQRRELRHADQSLANEIETRKVAESQVELAAQQQRRLAAAIEQTADAVVITDPSGRIQYVNAAFEDVTGFTRREAIGRNPRMLKSGEHSRDFYRDLWDTVLSGRVWTGHFINKKKDGSILREDATITPIVDGNGTITNFVSVKQDVTAKHQLEQQLRQAQKMEAIGQLAAGVAHDFNNLLTGITGYTQLALRSVRETPDGDDLEKVLALSRRAAELTQQLLAFSRRLPTDAVALDLNAIVEPTTKLLGRLIGENIEIVLELAADLGSVLADPGQMEQVIVNLCINARDAMPDGGRLTIETANLDLDRRFVDGHVEASPGPHVVLTVSDTGIGMDRATRERIFEPFFTTKAQGSGTGLGLATVHGIVRQHGGTIWVYSEPGEGSTFRVYLPRTEIEAAARRDEQRAESLPGGTETILVVEDEDAVRDIAERVLEDLGYTVLSAGDPEDARRVFADNGTRIDLVVSDMVMPVTHGRDLYEELQALRPGLRVLFMSGYATRGAHPIKKSGSPRAPFLRKPFTQRELAFKVREALDTSR